MPSVAGALSTIFLLNRILAKGPMLCAELSPTPWTSLLSHRCLQMEKRQNLFELQQQYYNQMSAEYSNAYSESEGFPLSRFAEDVYVKRIRDNVVFDEREFAKELAIMSRHKMVISYRHSGLGEDSAARWIFRHDKIMEFFLVQTFFGKDNERPMQHFSDPRFRGTYLQMANLLPLDAAEIMERQLVEYAADTRDHSVSDDFIKLLRSRKDI